MTGRVIGVLGGMGPAATADFYTKLVMLSAAGTDQAQPRVVIWADPTVPDRSRALTGDGPDPTPWLLNGVRTLERAGATVLAIPCNTAHAFLPRITGQVNIPVVHMIDEVAKFLAATRPDVRTAGVLATAGTVSAGLYQQALSAVDIRAVVPPGPVQRLRVDRAVRAVKAGDRGDQVRRDLLLAATGLVGQGAEVLIAGCTEIPLGLPPADMPWPLIDPALVLAQAVLAHIVEPVTA
ncbi:aspartate/glutamate racemase family protein [Kribbella sp. NPDC059898]|uniref:aspartate/glutamate racemase family protein n=1 Tax=Kribbella sp. NPDC059898 TaxID=3346995 RepID=UPI003663A9A3